MILLTIAMILGFSGVLVGGIMIAAGPALIGALVAGLGAPVGVLCLVAIVRLNRRYQDEARAAVLADPAQIVARWQDGANEVILAERGLCVGRAFYPFRAGYQQLVHASLAGSRLTLGFSNIAVTSEIRQSVEVPEAALPAVQGFVARVSGA